jgi:hypothetical protein
MRESLCASCEGRPCEDNPYNPDGECWRTPQLWADWLILKNDIARSEQEHKGLDLYSRNDVDGE